MGGSQVKFTQFYLENNWGFSITVILARVVSQGKLFGTVFASLKCFVV